MSKKKKPHTDQDPGAGGSLYDPGGLKPPEQYVAARNAGPTYGTPKQPPGRRAKMRAWLASKIPTLSVPRVVAVGVLLVALAAAAVWTAAGEVLADSVWSFLVPMFVGSIAFAVGAAAAAFAVANARTVQTEETPAGDDEAPATNGPSAESAQGAVQSSLESIVALLGSPPPVGHGGSPAPITSEPSLRLLEAEGDETAEESPLRTATGVEAGQQTSAELAARAEELSAWGVELSRTVGVAPPGVAAESHVLPPEAILPRLEKLEKAASRSVVKLVGAEKGPDNTYKKKLDEVDNAVRTLSGLQSGYASKLELSGIDTRIDTADTRIEELEQNRKVVEERLASYDAVIEGLRALSAPASSSPPELREQVRERLRPRYELLLRNEGYRRTLADWAQARELQVALLHFRDLYFRTKRRLLVANAGGLPFERREHWVRLELNAAARLHALLPFFQRLIRMRGVSDESNETTADMLRDIREPEESHAWKIIVLPQTMARLDASTVDRYLRHSAATIVTLLLAPLVQLYQEELEAPLHEAGGELAPGIEDYELGQFSPDSSPRGNVDHAIHAAAHLLGYAYRPIPLYSTMGSPYGSLLVADGNRRVTWRDWLGDESDRKSGVIVRVTQPAFLELGTNTPLAGGATAIIGGPGHADGSSPH